jgi:EAL domain-containing protein (putative c-di-GMP-specific phosphodiesterase class I)
MVKESTAADRDVDDVIPAEELDSALANDEFFLVYQPSIDLHTNAFAGVESLLRWRHPVRGVVRPDHFIPQLEASGLIVAVGQWALDTACHQGAMWHARGYRFSVSVNISSRQIEDAQFVSRVAETLDTTRFDPSLLVLELSQRTLLDGDAVTDERIADLQALGVRLSVDDFALGQSRLSDLDRFHVDVVKLTKASIDGVADSDTMVPLVHELVEEAKKREVRIVASGIEDAEQRRRLQIEQVDVGQGFYFSRPHEVAEVDRFLEDFALFSGNPL